MNLEQKYHALRKAALAMAGVTDDDLPQMIKMRDLLANIPDENAQLSASMIGALIDTHGETSNVERD